MIDRVVRAGVAAALLLILAVPVLAQTFPSQTVRIIVPISAGSVTDILARTIGEKLSEAWRQQVIVENRPGVPGVRAPPRVPRTDTR